MHKRLFFLTLALGVLVWGLGAMDARAGYVPLSTTTPLTTLDMLLPAGNFTTVPASPVVGQGIELSDFSYSVSAFGGALGPPPTAVNVKGSTADTGGPISGLPPGELGVQFQLPIAVTAGQQVDALLSYEVTALNGSKIHDVFLAGNPAATGTGLASVTETVTTLATLGGMNLLAPPGSLLISAPPSILTDGPVNLLSDQTSILVTKDIILTGGTNGTAQLSFMTQGYSLTTIPEPTSMALLGIGISGLIAFRRFFKRNSVA
jgi:hypothetical protein